MDPLQHLEQQPVDFLDQAPEFRAETCETGVSASKPVDAGLADADRSPPLAESPQAAAQALWDAAPPATADHPYLKTWGLQPHGLRVAPATNKSPAMSSSALSAPASFGDLLIPMRQGARSGDDICGIQRIGVDGTMAYQSIRPGTGLFFIVGNKAGQRDEKRIVVLTESFRAAESIRQATSWKVLACLDFQNLVAAVRRAHSALSGKFILILAIDKPKCHRSNPGLRMLIALAWELSIEVVVPPSADFNRLLHSEGGAKKISNAFHNSRIPWEGALPPFDGEPVVAVPQIPVAAPTHSPPPPCPPSLNSQNFGEPADIFQSGTVPALSLDWFPTSIAAYAHEGGASPGLDPTIIAATALVCAASLIPGHRLNPERHNLLWEEPARFWAAFVGDPSTLKAIQTADHHVRSLLPSVTMDAVGVVSSVPAPRGRQRKFNPTVDAFRAISPVQLSMTDDGATKRHSKKSAGSIDLAATGSSKPDTAPLVTHFGHAGTLQRFMLLVAAPLAKPNPDDGLGSGRAGSHGFIFEKLAKCNSRGLITEMSAEAAIVQRRVSAWAATMGDKMGSPWLKTWLLNADGLFARLVLTMHICDAAYGIDIDSRRHTAPVSRSLAETAEKLLCLGLFRHALHFDLHVKDGGEKGAHVQQLAKLILRLGQPSISRRDIQRRWKKARELERAQLDAALEMLCFLGWLQPDHKLGEGTGQPKHWVVNPRVNRFLKHAETNRAR